MPKSKKSKKSKSAPAPEPSESADFLDECQKLFESRDLYVVVGFPDGSDRATLSSSDIKKRYYKSSLIYHPDKAGLSDEGSSAQTHKFQVLSRAYSILAADESRKLYDETGIIEGLDSLSDGNTDWYAYWRNMFKPVTKADLDEFAVKYRESEQELTDLKDAYMEHSGCMSKIMEAIMCCTSDDEPRFVAKLQKLIKSGELPSFDSFTNETDKKKASRKRKAEKEAKAAEELLREIQQRSDVAVGSADNLAAAIRNRSQARQSNFLEQLEQKYAKPKPAGKKRTAKK